MSAQHTPVAEVTGIVNNGGADRPELFFHRQPEAGDRLYGEGLVLQLIADLQRVVDNCGASVTEQHIANLARAAIAKAEGSAS